MVVFLLGLFPHNCPRLLSLPHGKLHDLTLHLSDPRKTPFSHRHQLGNLDLFRVDEGLLLKCPSIEGYVLRQERGVGNVICRVHFIALSHPSYVGGGQRRVTITIFLLDLMMMRRGGSPSCKLSASRVREVLYVGLNLIDFWFVIAAC